MDVKSKKQLYFSDDRAEDSKQTATQQVILFDIRYPKCTDLEAQLP